MSDPARASLALALALPFVALSVAMSMSPALALPPGPDQPIEVAFARDGDRGTFTVLGRLEAPRGALVALGLSFDGQVVPGSWRRAEVGADGAIRMSWSTRASVLPGEYEAIATIDSSRQPRSIRGAFPGAARTWRAQTYVGEPEADVADEEALRRSLVAQSKELAALAREASSLAPIGSTSTNADRAGRRAFLERSDARADELERALAARTPPVTFAARLADLQEALAGAVRNFRQSLRVQAWQDADRGVEAPAFLDCAHRVSRAFLTLRELAHETARVQEDIERARAASTTGPRGVDAFTRGARALLRDLVKDGASREEVRRALRARAARLERTARDLAQDPTAAGLAGADSLAALGRDLGRVPADPKAREAIEKKLDEVERRVADERARRRDELEDAARDLVGLEADLKRLRDGRAGADARAEWRGRVASLRSRIAALPERTVESFPGARAQLDLVARALLARAEREGEAERAQYLDGLIRDALARVRAQVAPPR